MSTLVFISVVLGVVNCILLAIVIFILKQPNPNKGRELQELQELQERITDLSKSLLTFEKKLDKNITESRTESVGKMDRMAKDLGRQLQEIHDNL